MDEKTVKKMLGQRIKYLRKRMHLTQSDLGRKMEIDQRQVAYIEGGNCFPTLKTLNKFTKIFNCTLKDLFDYENYEEENIKTKISKEILEMDENKLKIFYKLLNVVEKLL